MERNVDSEIRWRVKNAKGKTAGKLKPEASVMERNQGRKVSGKVVGEARSRVWL